MVRREAGAEKCLRKIMETYQTQQSATLVSSTMIRRSSSRFHSSVTPSQLSGSVPNDDHSSDNTMTRQKMNDRTKGLAIAIFGIICVSPGAVLVQYLSTNGSKPWTIIFWKLLVSIPFSLSYAIYEAGGVKNFIHAASRNKQFYFAVACCSSCIDMGHTLSFVYTSAAVALLLINLNPLWAAIIGKLVLKDELPVRTYVALVLALGCMAIIFIPEMMVLEEDEHGNTAQQDDTTAATISTSFRGILISIFTGLMLAIYLCIVRKAGQYDVSLVGGTPLGAAISTTISLIILRGQVSPNLFWEEEMWKFWLAVVGQGAGIGIAFVALVRES